MSLHKEYGGTTILYEIKAYELQSFIIKFYDNLKKNREWDLYLISVEHGEKRNFDQWRTPIELKKEKTREEINQDLQLITMATMS